MKVEIISKQIIKPSFPIPNKPKSFKMSLLDQLAPPYYIPCVFFYHTNGSSAEKTSECLKSSLSETLAQFWPFAGRITDDFLIIYDNNNGGVEYTEAQVLNSTSLADILKNPEDETLKSLVPDVAKDHGTRPLVIVQSSFFGCGGMSLGISISHKISDGSTYAMFMNNCAKTAHGCPDIRMTIGSDSNLLSNLFPPRENFLIKASIRGYINRNGITRRFVFSSSSIAMLQNKASSSGIKRPTRFEAVSSLLWKTASCLSRSGTSGLVIPVNFRGKMSPPVPDHSIGNFFVPQAVQACDNDIELSELVFLLRGAIRGVQVYCDTETQEAQRVSMFLDNVDKVKSLKRNMYFISSWCRFPIYEANFGWGSPIWVGMPNDGGAPNAFILTDTKDGTRIEAWVTLTNEKMNEFEADKELLTFASVNPSVEVVSE